MLIVDLYVLRAKRTETKDGAKKLKEIERKRERERKGKKMREKNNWLLQEVNLHEKNEETQKFESN